jgi:predicted LPLAT superfamily acyltransferase
VTGDASGPAIAWTGRTRGGVFGNWFFLVVCRFLGLRMAYVFLVGVAAYFLVASRTGYRSSAEYLQRLWGPLPLLRRIWSVYRHFFSFGMMLLDRMAVLGGREDRFTFAFEAEDHVRTALAEGKGLILLTSHTGNWEVAAHLLQRYGVPSHVAGIDNEVEPIRRMMDGSMTGRQVRRIDTRGAFEHSVEILAALRDGGIVALLGDRGSGQALVTAPFLGKPAVFPAGAYLLAAVSGAPIMHTFVFRERGFRYRFIGAPARRLQLPPRGERQAFLEACVGEYVRRLETMLRQYPFQWCNFYPFWDTDLRVALNGGTADERG